MHTSERHCRGLFSARPWQRRIDVRAPARDLARVRVCAVSIPSFVYVRASLRVSVGVHVDSRVRMRHAVGAAVPSFSIELLCTFGLSPTLAKYPEQSVLSIVLCVIR